MQLKRKQESGHTKINRSLQEKKQICIEKKLHKNLEMIIIIFLAILFGLKKIQINFISTCNTAKIANSREGKSYICTSIIWDLVR